MRRRALLIFAQSPYTDCVRRGWPRSFRKLLEIQSFYARPEENFDSHLFTSPGFHPLFEQWTAIHSQGGASFAERLDNAVEALAQVGYEDIVIVGRDCPDLELRDIRNAFDELNRHALVLGPDHRGGCYLIGIHASDRLMLRGIQWQQNTDFRALLARFGREKTCQLAVKIDLDTWDDVRLLARSRSRWRLLAELLLHSQQPIWATSRLSASIDPMLFQRKDWQLPPPLRRSSNSPLT